MEASKISASALDVEWRRLTVIAQNLANAGSTRDAAGGLYVPMTLVSGPDVPFESLLDGAPMKPTGVRVLGLEAQSQPVQRSYEPGHPHADADGFVSRPSVDYASEMTLLLKSSRAYEANLAAIRIAHQMFARALEVGQR